MRRVRRVFALLAALCAVQANAQTGRVWQTYQSSPSGTFAGTELFFGVPRSSDLLISGSCQAPPTGAPFVRLAVFTGDLPAPTGAQVTVDVTNARGVTTSFAAQNQGPDEAVGLTLVETQITLDAPVWTILGTPGPLTYTVRGGPAITIEGSTLPVQDFLATCAARGGPQCSAAPLSQETGIPLALTVRNSSRGARGIVWVGPDGTRTEIARLNPGETGTLNTDAGHVWMFTDDQGRCVEMRQAGLSRSGIELFQPGPN